jgi:hypothetical protein
MRGAPATGGKLLNHMVDGFVARSDFRADPVRLRFQHRSRKTAILGLPEKARSI